MTTWWTTVNGWDELWTLYGNFQKDKEQWIFRGQPNAKDKLTTTLERVRKRFDLRWCDLDHLELAMIRNFKRQAHRYVENVPEDENTLEWLALMRHYGAPTRLMDWTYSFFVALFFAIQQSDEACAVWAINMDRLRNSAESLLDNVNLRRLLLRDPHLKSREFFDLVFRRKPSVNLVYSANPERLNERLAVQQGVFLAPANISKPFLENLAAMSSTKLFDVDCVRKITIDASVQSKKEILRHLQRMNITTTSLFPGLAGFAESLWASLANPDILKGRLPFETLGGSKENLTAREFLIRKYADTTINNNYPRKISLGRVHKHT